MIYTKFVIHKYRAIQNVEIELKSNLMPIIGVNESGKTSVLHAIMAFSWENDSYKAGEHLVAKNLYQTRDDNYGVSAHISFSSRDELKELLDSIEEDDVEEDDVEEDDQQYTELVGQLIKIVDDKSTLEVYRNLNTKEYEIRGIDTYIYEPAIVNFIIKNTPYVLYFDDFTDRVPSFIDFPDSFEGESFELYGEWHSILEEVFKRTNSDIPLEKFIKIEDDNRRRSVLADVCGNLNKMISEVWEKLIKGNEQLVGEEPNKLRIILHHGPEISDTENTLHRFIFKVEDHSNTGLVRTFDVSQRSKGYQWFFNFSMKLRYNPKYVENTNDAIFLLDEPGSYLHSSAQTELLNALRDISVKNRVIYCTHSQYLLDPDIVNIGDIRIAKRNGNGYDVRLIKYSSYDKHDSLGALTPLHHYMMHFA